MPDVFISYARADRDKVRLIAHGLVAEGFDVWWDPAIKPGKKWNDAIRRALDNSAAVVTVWSPKSVKSDWVVAETTHGNARKAMVPVTIKDCTPPIPYNMIQSADLTRWKGDADDGEWMAVLRQVRALVEAKRRLVAGAPPPGEAHGAEAREGAGVAEDVGRYTASATRGRMAARGSRLAIGAVVATVVISGGLWLAQGALTEVGFLAPKSQGLPPSETVAPSPAITPSDAVEVAPLPDAPPQPASKVPSPAPAAPERTDMPTPPTTPPDDRAERDALDMCAQDFARLCPNAPANATPVGFRADGDIAAAEQRFLSALQFSVARPVTGETAAACKARLAEAAATRRRATSGTVLSNACGVLSWPTPPTTTAPPPTTPQRTTPSITTVPERITSVTATAIADLRALDSCAAALPRYCPAPQPTAGFSADGAISTQETSLLASVSATTGSTADRLKACTTATANLQAMSAERRATGAFGQACRGLAPTLNPNVTRTIKAPAVIAQPPPAPPPPR